MGSTFPVGKRSNDIMKPTPGEILVTEDDIPLRFVVMGFHAERMYLYCSARDIIIDVNQEEFFETEDVTVKKMTVQKIRECINHKTAEYAKDAVNAYYGKNR